jgi:hypothetical protein
MTRRYSLPGWELHLLAAAPPISQILFAFDTLEADLTLIGAALPNIEYAGILPAMPTFRSDTRTIELPPPPNGWAAFGLLGTRRGTDVEIGNLQLGALAWFLLFEWNPSRSAWDALLEGQDALRPQKTSLTPEFILPAMFVTRMAHFPFERGIRNVATVWVACFAQAHTSLLPVISGCSRCGHTARVVRQSAIGSWRGQPCPIYNLSRRNC